MSGVTVYARKAAQSEGLLVRVSAPGWVPDTARRQLSALHLGCARLKMFDEAKAVVAETKRMNVEDNILSVNRVGGYIEKILVERKQIENRRRSLLFISSEHDLDFNTLRAISILSQHEFP